MPYEYSAHDYWRVFNIKAPDNKRIGIVSQLLNHRSQIDNRKNRMVALSIEIGLNLLGQDYNIFEGCGSMGTGCQFSSETF